MTSSEDVGLEDSALLGCPHLTMWMQSTGILTISTGLGPSDIISYYIKCHIVKGEYNLCDNLWKDKTFSIVDSKVDSDSK